MPLKVAIVEDDPRWRSTLELLLQETEGFECVGCYPSGEVAVAELPIRRPQVVLDGHQPPGHVRRQCTRKLREISAETQIVMLTVYDDSERIFHALQMGAHGYLLKRASADEILKPSRTCIAAERRCPPVSREWSCNHFSGRRRLHDRVRFSPGESEVLAYVARGYSDKEVADALGLSPATIRSYLKTIYGKLHVHSRTQAIIKAVGPI